MNRQETLKFLALVKVAYPSAYRDADRETLLATVNMWQSTFADLPYPIMETAFDSFRRRSKFPPTVAEIYDELSRIHSAAWSDLNEAAMLEDEDKFQKAACLMEITEQYLKRRKTPTLPYNALTAAIIAKSSAATLSLAEGE